MVLFLFGIFLYFFGMCWYLKGAAAPPAAGPFNSTLHTGDPILGLNILLSYFITYAIAWGPVEQGFPVA